MTSDPKQKALEEARREQAAYTNAQSQLDRQGRARRESFERAIKAGATQREIGDAVDLHHTRVGQVIRGE